VAMTTKIKTATMITLHFMDDFVKQSEHRLSSSLSSSLLFCEYVAWK